MLLQQKPHQRSVNRLAALLLPLVVTLWTDGMDNAAAFSLVPSSPPSHQSRMATMSSRNPIETAIKSAASRHGPVFKVLPLRASARVHRLRMASSDNDETGMSKKETTWDRLTGPKLFKTVTNWQGIHSVPLVPLRLLTGLLMIHHGSEGGTYGPANVGTPEFQGFIDYIVVPYFGFLPGPPELWSALHDYAEFYGGIFLAIGFLTRPAALTLFVTMLGAIYFHLSATGLQGFPLGHVPNYSYDFEEPTLYALIFLLFWFNGAGPLSVDSIIYEQIKKED